MEPVDLHLWTEFHAHRTKPDATTAYVIALYDPASGLYAVDSMVQRMRHIATPALWLADIALRKGGAIDEQWLARYSAVFCTPMWHRSLAQEAGPHSVHGQPDAPATFFYALDALEARLREGYPQAIWVALYESGDIQHGVRYCNNWTVREHPIIEFLTVLFSFATRHAPFLTREPVDDFYEPTFGTANNSVNRDYILAQFATFFAAPTPMDLEDAVAEAEESE